ncbi:MAG: multidrug efflux RND transporter permease subunit [Puniceicoccales bacterium]|jgi:multidrug efflux pump|nr:multidrug efflux RND transporter permease subunit [Puniceicoccales bacterium]
MARFFIDRPVFAWVIAIFLMLAGVLSITQMPVSQYPTIASPSVEVTITYPGASTKTLDESVTSVIEQELNGIPGLKYFESTSDASGRATIKATFVPGTDQDIAAVEVQNRIKRVEPRLPQAVLQQGVQIEKSNANFLCVVALYSPTNQYGSIELGDYVARNVLNEIKRVPGVGQAQAFATEKAMRIWIDVDKLIGLKLSISDVSNAIATQNVQIAAGTIGALPTPADAQNFALVTVTGQLSSADEFGDILLRANSDGSTVRLRDVAKVELGGAEYSFESRLDGKPSAAIGVQLSPTANALETAKLIEARMKELKQYFPPGIDYKLPFDTSLFVNVSIMAVVRTLVEAVVLVFIVMFIFLQNIRYTFIPTIVVPVSLLGGFAVMHAFGFSINVLTMFGTVLVIGMIVDDAIVVVENVERIMSEEGLPPREATRKAIGQITGAIVGMTLVLASVFVPMAFFGGAVGVIYRQFSLSMVAAIAFSAVMALSLTPALCANILRPHGENIPKRKGVGVILFWLPDTIHKYLFQPFFNAFNRVFGKITVSYEKMTGGAVKRGFRIMAVYAAVVVAFGWLYVRLPTSFLPTEDQGVLFTLVQLPSGATANRTKEVFKEIEDFFASEKGVDSSIGVMGFSFSGTGQNSGIFFTSLKNWSLRGPEDSAEAIAGRAFQRFAGIRDTNFVMPVVPPPIMELGTSSGIVFRLQDRGGQGHEALSKARDQLIGMMYGNSVHNPQVEKPLFGATVRYAGLEDAPQIHMEIDRSASSAMGVSFSEISNALGTAVGSNYVNDFPSQGRMQRVIIQAKDTQRLSPEDLLKLYLRNDKGEMVPMSAFAKAEWVMGPMQLVRYNGYPSMAIEADMAPGRTTGEGMAAVPELAKKLPPGFSIEWTAQSLDELESGSQAPFLISISLIFIFLLMAALYESWSIPLSVMLIVPVGALGAVTAVWLRGMPNDIYFLVGMIAIIGHSTKNAILIIEFAKEQQLLGKGLLAATIEGARLRFRPILMTSFAFILGVMPLYRASGAASASQRAIGTGIVGGMLAATILGMIFIPVFYVVVRKITGNRTSHYDEIRKAQMLADEHKS